MINPLNQSQRANLWNNTSGLSSDEIRSRLAQAKIIGMPDEEINALSKTLYSDSPDATTMPGMEAYAPAAAAEMMGAYQNYANIAGEAAPEMPDIVSSFLSSAPDYQKFAWTNANEYYSKYAPTAYKTSYSHDPVTAYQYTKPEIAAVQDISGVPKQIWDEIAQSEEERIRQSAKGMREQIAQAVAREGAGRRGATPFLLAEADASEAQRVDEARRQARIQEAQQKAGMASQTQSLEASRASQQASMEQRADEAQAQEIARVQGINIEDARYMVEQKKYEHTQATDEAKYKTGLDQAYQEANANESEKAYQAAYGKAQDVSGLQLTQHQQAMSDKQARAQAALARAQAAQGIASQTGTYDVQKEKERNAGDEEMANTISGIASTAGSAGGLAGGTLTSASAPTVNKGDMRSRFALNKAKTATA